MATSGGSEDISTNLHDATILFNAHDTYACKVANIIQCEMEGQGLTVSHITPQDEESVKTAVEKVAIADCLSIVATPEFLGPIGCNLHELIKGKRKLKSGSKVLVVKLNMDEELPEGLAKYKIIDYNEVKDFKDAVTKIIASWLKKANPNIHLVFELTMNIQVHQQKSKVKDKTKEFKKIRETLWELLDDIPGNAQTPELRTLLLQTYKVNITSVQLNPLCFEGNLKGEHHWNKLNADCQNDTLSTKFMATVKKYMKKSHLPFSLKLVLTTKSRKENEIPRTVENTSYILMDTKTTIIRDQSFSVIEKKEYLPYDFALILNQHKTDIEFVKLHSEKDMYNLLHAIVAFNRLELMIVLVHFKLWRPLMQESVPLNSPTSWKGHTAMQMAEQRKTRKIKDEIVKIETLFNSMGKFLKACHDGDRAAVERQLRQNAEVIHERDSLKNNCLYWTIVSGNLDLFKYLVDQKAEFDNVNEEKENLLHVACKLGRSQFIKPLLFKCANDVLAVCNAKKTPLERVAENGDLDSLKEFLKNDVQIIPSSLLPLAAGNKRIHFIRYLLDESGRSIDVDSQDKDGFTAFTKSCDNGANEIFQYLLTKGVKTNIPDKRRRGPLYYAAKSGHRDLVQSLILLGSDVNIQDKYTGSEACFLIRGKDKGRYAWHYVEVRRNVVHIFTKKTRSGQVDVAKYGTVIKSGWGQDPEQGIVDWINKMYDDRAERPNAPGDMSPLHVAIYRERREVAAFLIENGADINLKDLFGTTPFMYCAIRNDLATATLLANKGANLNERDNEGFTALEIAKMNEHPEMINYIEGINYMNPVQKFVEGEVRACERNLSTRRIDELRQKGEDVKRHTIDELRSLQIAVNCLLLDLGSGPVMKPTDAETEATMDTTQAPAMPVPNSYAAYEGSLTMGNPSEDSGIYTLPSAVSSMDSASYHPTPSVERASGSSGDLMSTGSTITNGDSQYSFSSNKTIVPPSVDSGMEVPDHQEETAQGASAQFSSSKANVPRNEEDDSRPKQEERQDSIRSGGGSEPRTNSTVTLSSCASSVGGAMSDHSPPPGKTR